MGHLTDYSVLNGDALETALYATSESFCSRNVDREENPSGSYYNAWKKHSKVFDCYDDAVDFLDAQGTYVDGAVRYKEPTKVSKKMQTIKERIEKLLETRKTYDKEHDVRNRKSDMIGCKNCNSKVAKEFLKSNRCPVCGKDLRAEYILEKLEDYDRKTNRLRKEYDEAKKKQASKNPTIKWVVKTEVHC